MRAGISDDGGEAAEVSSMVNVEAEDGEEGGWGLAIVSIASRHQKCVGKQEKQHQAASVWWFWRTGLSCRPAVAAFWTT